MAEPMGALDLASPRTRPGRVIPHPAAGMSDDILDYLPALRAFARGLCRGGQDPDDLVQETLLRAIEYADSYRPGTNLRAWLFTIMRSRFYNNCRRAGRETTGQIDCVSALPASQPSQEWHLRHKEMLLALDRLPPHYREALVLISVLGESYVNAAVILDCDIGTIKSRVSRARRILRTMLNPEF
ncbi:sigma-70 family RNA polymerase sigma factor [Paracoccus lichenicola]